MLRIKRMIKKMQKNAQEAFEKKKRANLEELKKRQEKEKDEVSK